MSAPVGRDATKPIASIETFTRNPLSIVRVTLADGTVGYGQLAPYHADISAMILHQQLAPLALGQPVEDIPAFINGLLVHEYKFPGSYLCRAAAGLDTALWDARGRCLGRSVTELLGGTPHPIAVYGSSMRRDITPEAEADRLQRLAGAHGYRAFKIRVGTPLGQDVDAWPGRTETIISTVRRRLGPALTLLADANGGYTPERAVTVGRLLESEGYRHFEEPCPFPELEWTAEVAAALDIPVAGGEQDTALSTWRRMLRLAAVDIVQPDVGYIGGLSRALQVARMAASVGLPCTPHVANRSLLAVFTMHLLAAIPNAGPYMEHSIESTPWTDALFDPAVLTVRDGAIRFPEGPGWGVEPNAAWLAHAAHQESRLNPS